MQRPAVDIIIPTRNRGALINTTIASIRASTYQHFTLWVVDQSDTDATEACVAAHMAADARVRYLRDSSRGISAARNVGVQASSTPFLLFTDDDCRVAPTWVEYVVQELQSEAVCAVFGRIVAEPTDRALHTSVPDVLPLAVKLATRRAVYTRNRLDLGFGHGANMALNRECYQHANGFDELLGVGGKLHSWEDRDLGYRLLRLGGRIVYTPKAEVYHRQWRDWQEVQRVQRSYALGAGAAAAKYIRCGDPVGWLVLGEWLLSQGLRQLVSGVFKWQSQQKIMAGLQNLYYPWVGMLEGLRYGVDKRHYRYVSPPVATQESGDL